MRTSRSLAAKFALPALCSLALGACADERGDDFDPAALAQEAEAPIQLVGTWAVTMKTSAEIAAPLIGKSATNVELAMKLSVAEVDGELRADYQICKLLSNSATLRVDYTPLLPYFTTSNVIPGFEPEVGGPVPLPDLVFRVGQDESGRAVDQDNDRRPGATLPVTALGLLNMSSYTGFALSVKLDAVLKDASTVEGTANFSATGKVFGSSSPLLQAGEIRVTQTETSPTFTAARVEGDPSCAQLVAGL